MGEVTRIKTIHLASKELDEISNFDALTEIVIVLLYKRFKSLYKWSVAF
jgi:hypothetical protein